jgi:hypothetical protein
VVVSQPMQSSHHEPWAPMGEESLWHGELTQRSWRALNRYLSMGALSREEVITDFCALYRIPRWRVEAELATYRLLSPDQWQ